VRSMAHDAREAIRNCLLENQALEVLRELPEEVLQQLLDCMTRVKVNAGESLFEQGGDATAMFAVERGELKVMKRLLQADQEELEVTTLGPGAYVGEEALLYNRPCTESVVVQGEEPAVLWRLERAHFFNVVKQLAAREDVRDDEVCTVDLDRIGDAKSIFVVSDGTGDSAESAMNLALKQFAYTYREECGNVSVTKFSFVRYRSEAIEIARRARAEDVLVIYTLMRPEPREAFLEEVRRTPAPGENILLAVDLWEKMLSQMECHLGIPRRPEVSVSAMRPDLSDACLRMVEAIEYTRKLDDGVHPELWSEADVILIGLSRAGKTPISFFLAQRGVKVANYPVVPDEEPPEELFHPGLQSKCVALTIKAERLKERRTERMFEFGRGKSSYASLQTCVREVAWLKTFYMRRGPRWPVVDTTSSGVEEIATKILKVLEKRKEAPSASPQFHSPSVA